MLTSIFLLGLLTTGALAGSLCPPRENIYPCSCVNIPLGKGKVYSTTVNCHRLESTDSLNVVFPTLRTMQIDVFHLYDSFWNAHKFEVNGQDKKVLPTDWLNDLKVKELEIVDTTLSSNFACGFTLSCKNNVIQRFTAVNSSSHEKITTLCESARRRVFSWISCMTRLKYFHFSHAQLSNLDNFFQTRMNEMMVLNLTHNQISTIKSDTFKLLPRLKSLDLSHNQLESLENVFVTSTNLEFLDVSWNSLTTLGDDFFKTLPYMKTFKLVNNEIIYMKESEWKSVPESLRNIDISDNPLHCDCNIQWINNTFHINVVLQGRCSSPEEYENSLLRKASRFLNERCDGDIIGTRLRTTPATKKLLAKYYSDTY